MSVNLGDKAKDTITGVTGIVVVYTTHLNGCIHIGIEPQELKDGKPLPVEFFDIQRIEVIEPGAFKQQKHTDAPIPGGPSRAASPTRQTIRNS